MSVGALRVVSGDLIDNSQVEAAKLLDSRIRECLRDYVQLGKLLMEMRDNQAYRLVGPYDTFEDYCKDVEGLAYRTAQTKILAYLVQDGIAQNLGRTNVLPSTESQVRQLFEHDGAIAKFRTEKRIVQKRDGTNTSVEVPVAVANPKKVAEQWIKTVKAHEETVARAERLYQEKLEKATEAGEPLPPFRRPKLTGSFVVNQLPPMYQPARKTSGEAHHFVRWMSQVMKGIESIDKMYEDEERWNRLVSNPDRKKLTKQVVAHIVSEISEAEEVLRMFKKDLTSEFISD